LAKSHIYGSYGTVNTIATRLFNITRIVIQCRTTGYKINTWYFSSCFAGIYFANFKEDKRGASMNKTKFIAENGVGLLEVLVSILVLSIGILGLAPLIVLSIEGNIISRDNSDAAQLLKEKIEYYEALDSLPTLPYNETEAGIDSIFSRSITLKDNTTDSLVPVGLCQIDVVISWLDNQNVQRATTYSSFIVK
jgi:type II secretory pathway pseudopilin PulG